MVPDCSNKAQIQDEALYCTGVPTSWADSSCDLSRLAALALSTAERTSIREILKSINQNWILPSLEARMVRLTKKFKLEEGSGESKQLEPTIMEAAESRSM